MNKTPVHGTLTKSLAEAVRLVVGNAEAVAWINNARTVLIAARPHVQEMSMRLPEASAADCAETLNQIDAALAANNQEAWVEALLNAPNPERPPAVGGEDADVRWAVNVLLEKIAEKFEGWDTFDLFRSEAAATVRSFKHDLAAQPASPLRDQANYKIGKWLSAALEDPNVCAEMKADISEWFDVFCTCGGDLKQLPEHHDISCPVAINRKSETLAGCLHPGNEPNSCQYEGSCLSMACNHHGKTWYGPRMTLEAQDPDILYLGHEICSSCGRVFKFGDTCPRGGCPCGGDV